MSAPCQTRQFDGREIWRSCELGANKASGKTEIVTLTPAEKNAIREALLPVHKEVESRIGKDLIAAFYAEAKASGY